jgi:hypothetical protein
MPVADNEGCTASARNVLDESAFHSHYNLRLDEDAVLAANEAWVSAPMALSGRGFSETRNDGPVGTGTHPRHLDNQLI